MLKLHYWLPKLMMFSLWLAAGSILYARQVGWSPHQQRAVDLKVLSGEFDQAQAAGIFHGRNVISQAVVPSVADQTTQFKSAQKRIEVDLTNQRLYAFEGDKKIYDFLISSGKWGRTPTGTFKIWGKYRYTKMSGGSQLLRTYYYLPNVPYVMFFSNSEIAASRGFSLHGTYWHDNFGTPMSHGCINMKTEEAGLIYYWSNPIVGEANATRTSSEDPGTEIIIYGTAPQTI